MLYIVRLWDMFDGWIDVSKPLSHNEALAFWSEKTGNGTHNTQFSDGDYYKVFPADTAMLFTPDYFGR